MRNNGFCAVLAGAALASIMHAGAAHALNVKSWVSSVGSDALACASPLDACATFAGALAKTAAGGEIGVVTPGDYGAVTIDKSVSITNDGSGEAGILAGVFGGRGVTIDAGQGDIVGLRGLVIDGQVAGNIGIFVLQVSAAHIQNCVIRNFEQAIGGFGIAFTPPHTSQLFVSDTIIFNNGSSQGTGGIFIRPKEGIADVVLDRVHVENNVDGLLIDGTFSVGTGSHVVVRESVFSGNAANGIHAFTVPGGASAFAYVERSSSVDNAQSGILAEGPGATVLLNDSTVARNSLGITTANSGQLISYRNNRINNNVGPDGTPTGFYRLN